MSTGPAETRDRAVWSEVDLGAIRHNVRVLGELADPAELLVVVKANAYGHGAVPVALAALDAGAAWLGVARVEEGVQLREAGIEAPILLLSEAPTWAADTVVGHGLTPVVYTEAGIDAIAKAVATSSSPTTAVHLKIDTGMHRVGCAPEAAVALAEQVVAHDELVLGGVCTHLAVADEPDDPYTAEQLRAFDAAVADLCARGLDTGLLHAANSAAALACPSARYDLVRVGISVYGIPPSRGLAGGADLRPAMTLTARVMFVKTLPAGARLSYGLRYELGRPARIATVPAGYADGVPRNLGVAGGEVLIGGIRYPIAGIVTMDQLMVDVGDAPVEAGDEVVLLGAQGDDEVSALEWAEHLGTISYEIVTGIGARVPRRYRG
ncbi:MAG: alanine racemase [Acidimicrobiia bacterium]